MVFSSRQDDLGLVEGLGVRGGFQSDRPTI